MDNNGIKKHFRSLLTDLSSNWSTFAKIIFNPFIFISLAILIILVIFSNNVSDSLDTFFSVIISIVSGIVGAIMAKKWSELREEGILVTRGKSAIRGLKLLLLSIHNVENRIKEYISDIKKDEDKVNKTVMLFTYQELVERCNLLEEEALNAIEEWEDIIPEADITTQIGLISKLKNKKQNLEKQIEDTNKQLKKAEKESEDSAKLENKLKEKENELAKVRNRLKEKENDLNSSVIGGVSSPTFSIPFENVDNIINANEPASIDVELPLDNTFNQKYIICNSCKYQNYIPTNIKNPKCVNCGEDLLDEE